MLPPERTTILGNTYSIACVVCLSLTKAYSTDKNTTASSAVLSNHILGYGVSFKIKRKIPTAQAVGIFLLAHILRVHFTTDKIQGNCNRSVEN